MSNRASDNKTEKIINTYLFNKYFSKFDGAEMVTDTERQIRGIDIMVRDISIDLKAQTSKRYLNNPTDTFILELSFINRAGKENIGWFLNDDVLTDYYCFIWVPATETNNDGLIDDIRQIKKLEVMLVNKHALKTDVLNTKSITEIEEISNKMRENGYRHNNFNSEVHFSYTSTLREQPINLVCKKSYLKKFAVKHFTLEETVDKDGNKATLYKEL